MDCIYTLPDFTDDQVLWVLPTASDIDLFLLHSTHCYRRHHKLPCCHWFPTTSISFCTWDGKMIRNWSNTETPPRSHTSCPFICNISVSGGAHLIEQLLRWGFGRPICVGVKKAEELRFELRWGQIQWLTMLLAPSSFLVLIAQLEKGNRELIGQEFGLESPEKSKKSTGSKQNRLSTASFPCPQLTHIFRF